VKREAGGVMGSTAKGTKRTEIVFFFVFSVPLCGKIAHIREDFGCGSAALCSLWSFIR
jgi:hypothetical protein